MPKIKCPKCGEVFIVDENDYDAIVKQVRDSEFEKSLEKSISQLNKEKDLQQEILLSKANSKNKELANSLTKKIEDLEAKLSSSAKDFEIKKAQDLHSLEAQVLKLKSELELSKKDSENKVQEASYSYQVKISELNSQLNNASQSQELAIAQIVQEKDKKISALEMHAKELESRSKITEQTQKESFELKLKMNEEEIARLKDYKAKLSTKMLGESLEQHCETAFNTLRSTAFPLAYFEKDNDAKAGSKGDYIFRESSPDDVEYISIMFEMKNEMDTTATKHKNEDFFKELDKDRNAKGCEYAILVSLLEADSDLYNAGIVDVSYRYPKMYVIRPQFFIAIISILRNAALNSLKYKQEAQAYRNQNIDITDFEEKMDKFKTGFAKNFRIASDKFSKAIKDIDDSIKALQDTKANLLSSEKNLQIANNKAEDLTIKKLTYKNPTMKNMFAALEGKDSDL